MMSANENNNSCCNTTGNSKDNKIREYLNVHTELYGYINNVYDDDYGCEERTEDSPKMLIIEIITIEKIVYRKIIETKYDALNYHENMYLLKKDLENFI